MTTETSPHPDARRGMDRRRFLATLVKGALATGAAGAGLGLASVYSCVVTRKEIVMEGLPAAFDGFRVGLMSDFNHSRWIPAAYLASVVARANRLGADLFALTGDFVHRGGEWAPECARVLSRLRAPFGSFAVLGNHDHYRQAAPFVRDALARAGITELHNRGIPLRRGGEVLRVAGTGDLWRGKPDLAAALTGARRDRSVLLLQHNPDYVERLQDERVGLVLSGHTHGGQVVLPFWGPPVLPSRYGQKYASGLCCGPLAQVFVTTGVGSGFPPVRYGCPPEIALLTLRSGHHRA